MPGHPLDPFKLTKEQLDVFDAFQNSTEAGLPVEDDPYRNPIHMFRFVRGYKYNLEDAKKAWKDAIAWRTANTPWRTKEEEVTEIAKLGFVTQIGRSKKGEPSFMVKAKQYEKGKQPLKELGKYIFYLCEKALRECVLPMLSSVFIFDLNGFSLGQYSNDLKTEVMGPMQLVYPELLGKGILVNSPVIFQGVWKIVSPFLDPVTLAKISVNGKDFADSLSETFEQDCLPEEYRVSSQKARRNTKTG